jgi:hypothetical protein
VIEGAKYEKVTYFWSFTYLRSFCISGCVVNQTEDSEFCTKPYIRVGNSCCLDTNANNICDTDGSTEPTAEVVVPEESNTDSVAMVDCGYAREANSPVYDCIVKNLETCNRAIVTSYSHDTIIINGFSGNFCSVTVKEYLDTIECNIPKAKLYKGMNIVGFERLVVEFCDL